MVSLKITTDQLTFSVVIWLIFGDALLGKCFCSLEPFFLVINNFYLFKIYSKGKPCQQLFP